MSNEILIGITAEYFLLSDYVFAAPYPTMCVFFYLLLILCMSAA